MQIVRLLLVEDSQTNRELMDDYLRHLGFEVLSLPDGTNFLNTVAEFEPHLILLDLKLPGVDGFTLLAQFQNSEWSHIPVIVVSAYAFQKDQQRALDLGARRYLIKPTKLSELKQVIAEELSSVGQNASH